MEVGAPERCLAALLAIHRATRCRHKLSQALAGMQQPSELSEVTRLAGLKAQKAAAFLEVLAAEKSVNNMVCVAEEAFIQLQRCCAI